MIIILCYNLWESAKDPVVGKATRHGRLFDSMVRVNIQHTYKLKRLFSFFFSLLPPFIPLILLLLNSEVDPAQQRKTEHYLFAIHTARREWESPGTQNQPNMSALRHPQRCGRPVENATHKINKRQSIRLGRQYNAERTSASVCLFTTIFFFFCLSNKTNCANLS